LKVFSYLNSLTRQQQVIFILTSSLLVLIFLSFFLNFIQKTANNFEIERNKTLTEERLINKINFFPGFVNQDNVSISSLITNTSGDFKINIDRTQVIDDQSIIVWINDADFMRLYDWLFSIQDRVSMDKTSLTKSSGGRVSAQLNLSKI
tara:strand:- start:880 stop:1326 length:447 start_codon:yes stop_codon:yes gene_type:complete